MRKQFQRSFLKWAGGKYAALEHVFKSVPKTGEHWVEPFVGSGTVALNTNYKHYTLADNNPVLIHLYKMIVKDPMHVISALQLLFQPENNRKEAFLALRSEFNKTNDMDRKAVLFVYLNRHCFNGLMRFNKRDGAFNTSFGSFKKVYLPIDEIMYFSKKFQHATFIHGCFSTLQVAQPETSKSTVYCDPPYLEASKTANFTGYTSDGFDESDHFKLNKHCELWRVEGFRTFVSNSDVPVIDSLYSGQVKKKRFDVRRSISMKGESRTPAKEVLLIY